MFDIKFNRRCSKRGALAAGSILAFGALVVALPAAATSLADLNFGNYAVIELGNGKTFTMNSGPLTGNLLVGNGAKVSTSGGGNGQITGTINYDSSSFASQAAAATAFSGLQIKPTTTPVDQFASVSTSVTSADYNTAASVSTWAAGLTATQTIATINNTTTITGNGGINVIDVGSIQNPKLTLSGGANDYFIFNVTGNLQDNQAMSLTGGVMASHVLFNLLGTSGNIFQTSGGNSLFGTFLATHGGDFQFSALNLTGELINTAGNINFVSNSLMTAMPFIPVPLPPSVLLLASALAGLVLIGRRNKTNLLSSLA